MLYRVEAELMVLRVERFIYNVGQTISYTIRKHRYIVSTGVS